MLRCNLKIIILGVFDLCFLDKCWSFPLVSFLCLAHLWDDGASPSGTILFPPGTILSLPSSTSPSEGLRAGVYMHWNYQWLKNHYLLCWHFFCHLFGLANISCQGELAAGKRALGVQTICQTVVYSHLGEEICLACEVWNAIPRQERMKNLEKASHCILILQNLTLL